MRFRAVAAALILAASIPGLAPAAGLPITAPVSTKGLASHHALYTLTLDKAPGGDVVAAHGTMGYEVMDACDGWATRQRLNIIVTNADGQDIRMVSDYATWESIDGLKFRFHMKQTTEGAVTSQTDGYASLDRRGGPGVVHYTLPKPKVVKLPPGTLFPMTHTATLLAGAREGKRFMALPLFDGTDDNGAEDSSVVVVDVRKPFQTRWPALSVMPSARVRLAFFDRKPDTMLPNYEVGMRYWENGVADDMQMDFGDFVMDGKMTEFRLLPHKC
ncbi:MAG TPA: cell envelope integrity EipB family protein [Acetobacteraceae bacterium]|nr:cell envelope integrity EipB family protein [Acetobacteraceae bacterium]